LYSVFIIVTKRKKGKRGRGEKKIIMRRLLLLKLI